MTDLPQLAQLPDLGLAVRASETLSLTDRGIECSDVIGPWLYSERVKQLMEQYEWR